MSRLVSVAAVVFVGVLTACGDQPIAEPAPPTPQFMQGGSGVGAVFLANPFIGILFTDAAGNQCLSLVSPPTDDLNDFVRVDPSGNVSVHVTDSPASIAVTTAGGQVFTGAGTLTFNINDVTSPSVFVATAAGRVSSGAVTSTALCTGTTDGQGVVRLPDVIKVN